VQIIIFVFMKKKMITIKDIAEKTGYSISTVSRSLKDHSDITEKTKQIVRDTAKDLGYQPNFFAQNFKSNRSNIIGILVPDIERGYYSSIISGMQERAIEQKFFIVACQSKDSFMDEIKAIQTLIGLNVDGIAIVHSKETSNFAEHHNIIKNNVPLLAIDRELFGLQTHFVSNDQFVAGFMIGEHLAKEGYKNIAIIGGPEQLVMSRQRINGCVAGASANGVLIKKENIVYCDLQREREIFAVSELLNKKEAPDAIFCIYDRGAIEIVHYLNQQQINIPQKVAVAGCGNDSFSPYLTPSLTTVDLNPHKLGELAAEILINDITTGSAVEKTRNSLRPKLVVRNSTIR
jgi:DNA-binding LacI/PurR family transcriptional regulator